MWLCQSDLTALAGFCCAAGWPMTCQYLMFCMLWLQRSELHVVNGRHQLCRRLPPQYSCTSKKVAGDSLGDVHGPHNTVCI